MKRNLSGIYIFSNTNGKREPVCLEEATHEEQDKWLNSLDKQALVMTCMSLAETLNEIAEKLDLYRSNIP